MKRILLGMTTFLAKEEAVADVIGMYIKPLPQNANLDTLRLRVKVAGKLSQAVKDKAAFIDVEDAEHAEIKRALEHPPFTICEEGMVKAADAVLEAKEIEVPSASKA